MSSTDKLTTFNSRNPKRRCCFTLFQRFGADSLPEDASRTELYRRLLVVRKKVALEAACNPYQVKPVDRLISYFKVVLCSLFR